MLVDPGGKEVGVAREFKSQELSSCMVLGDGPERRLDTLCFLSLQSVCGSGFAVRFVFRVIHDGGGDAVRGSTCATGC